MKGILQNSFDLYKNLIKYLVSSFYKPTISPKRVITKHLFIYCKKTTQLSMII